MKNYNDFQNAASSEKVLLCLMNGTKQLKGFVAVSGTQYKIARNNAFVVGISVNGNSLSLVNSLDDLNSDSYYLDDEYIYVSSAANPNSRDLYYVLKQKFFFSDKGVSLPNDLDSGFEVYFEPCIKQSSSFGVELDTVNEGLSAIEGDGSISFNTNEFWNKNFDKITFDNQIVELYSWNSNLKASESKVIFTGIVDSKAYKSDLITFKLKDLLYKLRTSFELKNIAELGLRNSPNLDTAKQRIIYGRVQGFLPVNVDATLNSSYPIKGTVSLFNSSNLVVGTDTEFKNQLVANDKLFINGVSYSIQKVLSNTNLTLTANYMGVNVGPVAAEVIPTIAKTYINRQWVVSGHALSEPETAIRAGSTTQLLFVDSTQDFFKDDILCIDYLSGTELVKVRDILNETTISLSQTTTTVYPDGTRIYRPCVQNVKMDDITLVYGEDYSVDASAGLLSLAENAELNRAPILESKDRVTVTTGDSVLVGSNTKFTSYLKPGYIVRPQSTDDWYQILEVNDTQITLTEQYMGTSFTTNEALAEKTSISGLSDYRADWKFYTFSSAIQLQGKYFTLWDSEGSVAVWFDVGNIGTVEPVHNCKRGIQVSAIDPGNSITTILQRIAQKLNQDAEFEASIVAGELVIKSKTLGVRPVALSAVNNDFEVFNRTSNQQVVTLTEDIGDSLDETGFYLYDSTGSVFFWYAVDNSIGAVEPSHDGYRAVKITTVNTDDNVSTVRSKTKAVIDVEGFSSSNQASNQLVVNGSMQSATVGTVPNATLTTTNPGKSAYNLNSKHFIIPYYDGTACFWFNVDGLGVNPGISATTTTAILLDSNFEESDIFSAIGDAIDAHLYLESEVTENSILIIDATAATLTHTLSVGTSGLTIVQAQAGISSNPEAGAILQFKNYIFSDSSVLSLDVYGKTNSSGKLLQTAPQVVLDILETAGMGAFIDYAHFATASDYFNEEICFTVPETYSDKASNLTFRDVINSVNSSVLGILLQDNNFKMQYSQLKPSSRGLTYFDETDIIEFKVEGTNSKSIKEALVEYDSKEYDTSTKTASVRSVSRSSKVAEYVTGVTKSKTFESYLKNESDAQRLANRWGFLLEQSSGSVSFTTKLSAIQLQVGSIIQVSHPKFFERFGGSSKLKLLMVESVSKSSRGVEVSCVDLSNAFSRVAKITDTNLNYENASDETRLIAGFISDENGSINGIEESFNTNLIW